MAPRLLQSGPEAQVSKRNLGMLVTMAGSALVAWWAVTQQRSRASSATPDRGTVIFDNTPKAADSDAVS
jgi:hypothetical protein